MASKAATLGDPRRPSEIKKYVRQSADDEAPSPLSLLGLILAMGAMLLKMKLLSWAAVFVALANIAHLKQDSADYRQLVMTLTFAGMGLFNSYFIMQPVRQPAAAAPAAAAAGATAT